MAQLGTCDKTQYEHCGPHEEIEQGQKLPPFPCVNWKPVTDRILIRVPTLGEQVKKQVEQYWDWKIGRRHLQAMTREEVVELVTVLTKHLSDQLQIHEEIALDRLNQIPFLGAVNAIPHR